jgi:hypothetical protein
MYAGIIFEEPQTYIDSIFGNIIQKYATLISIGSNRYIPAFYQPALFKQGKLNLCLEYFPLNK